MFTKPKLLELSSRAISAGAHAVKNAKRKLCLLVCFKARGGTTDQLLTLFQLKIRTLAEFAAPAFHGALTQQQSDDLEMIQEKAFAIILGLNYKSYNNALTVISQDKLSAQRFKLFENFSVKCVKSERHADIFPLKENNSHSTRFTKPFCEPKCKTSRYYNSAVPNLKRLLNKKAKK